MGQVISSRRFQRKPCDVYKTKSHCLAKWKKKYGIPDLTLVVKSQRFLVHRAVLVHQSDYFRCMLSQFIEKDMSEVELKEIVEPEMMLRILSAIYDNSELTISSETVHELLLASTFFQISNLQTACVKYLKDKIDKKNVISLYLCAVDYGPYELQLHTETFILHQFERVVRSSREFTKLSKNQLVNFISSSQLLVSSEGAVYKAVLKWVGADPKTRGPELQSLLQYVNFPLMSKNEVEQHMRDSRVKRNKNLTDVLTEAKKYMEKKPEEKIQFWTSKEKPARWPKIFVVIRMYWKNLPMEFYNFKTKEWQELGTVCRWRSCTSLASHGSRHEVDEYANITSKMNIFQQTYTRCLECIT